MSGHPVRQLGILLAGDKDRLKDIKQADPSGSAVYVITCL